MSPIPEDAHADVAAQIVGLARRIQERQRAIAGIVPLSDLEVMALRDVHRHPGTTAVDLARRLGLRDSNTSVVLRGLVERGMIERSPDPEDRRRLALHLTERAERSITRVRAAAAGFLGEHMTLAEADELRDRLGRVERSCERLS